MADLWHHARQQVAEFEQKSAELGLLLSTEKAALDAVEKEVKKLQAERVAFSKGAQAAVEKAAEVAAQLAALRSHADKAAKDSCVLHKHLELLRASQRDASRTQEEDRQRYHQHLAALRGQLDQYKAHLQAAAAGGAAGGAA